MQTEHHLWAAIVSWNLFLRSLLIKGTRYRKSFALVKWLLGFRDFLRFFFQKFSPRFRVNSVIDFSAKMISISRLHSCSFQISCRWIRDCLLLFFKNIVDGFEITLFPLKKSSQWFRANSMIDFSAKITWISRLPSSFFQKSSPGFRANSLIDFFAKIRSGTNFGLCQIWLS